jgi:hypothetical protein
MGNTCSKKTTQPDSIRVQEDNYPNSDERPMSIWDYNAFGNPVSEPDNTGLYEKIYLASFYNPQSGYFCGHLFIVGFQMVDGNNEPREYRQSFFFFKFETKPTKITIQKQTNGELKISFIGDRNIILFDQVWFSSEYEFSEDGNDLRTIVKKKMIVNVSSNVQSDNGAGASALQTDVQRLSVNSQTDGSATLAPEFVSSDLSASSANTVHEIVSSASSELHSHQDFNTVKLVCGFCDKKYNYTVCSNRIEYTIESYTFYANLGIPSISIKNILVYEIEKSLFLIVIHTFDRQVYLSGHSGTSTFPIFVKAKITTHDSVGQPNLFESIEFDSSNSLRFQINTTNWIKMFSIDNCDGSIRQLDCQWKKL